MNRSGYLVLRAGIALLAAATSTLNIADEAAVLTQDLGNVRASGKITAALWTRRPDSYTLQLVLDRSRYQLMEASAAQQADNDAALLRGGAERSADFIGKTIANLRDLDPSFGCRSTPVVNGPPGAAMVYQPPLLQIWLLRADGTQIRPIGQSSQPRSLNCLVGRIRTDDVLYRFSIADSAQAVAAAIRIGDDYYIEKLRTLEPVPVEQPAPDKL